MSLPGVLFYSTTPTSFFRLCSRVGPRGSICPTECQTLGTQNIDLSSIFKPSKHLLKQNIHQAFFDSLCIVISKVQHFYKYFNTGEIFRLILSVLWKCRFATWNCTLWLLWVNSMSCFSFTVKAGGKRVVKKNSEDNGTPEKDSKRADKPRYGVIQLPLLNDDIKSIFSEIEAKIKKCWNVCRRTIFLTRRWRL